MSDPNYKSLWNHCKAEGEEDKVMEKKGKEGPDCDL